MNHSRRIFVVLIYPFILVLGYQQFSGKEAKRGPLLWDLEYLNEITRDGEYAELKGTIIRKADSYLESENISVVQKSSDKIADKHYYYSIGIYMWPDETDKTKPYVWRDGRVNPEYKEYDYDRLQDLVDRCKYLSVAYYITRNDKYYNKLLGQINCWFIDNDTKMYPNFEYGQVSPGHNNGKGSPEGISEARFLVPVLESVLLVDKVSPITDDMREGLQDWNYEFAKWMLNSEIGRKEQKATDNHAFIYDALLLYMSVFSNHEELANETVQAFRGRLLKHINNKGQFERELTRTQAYSYSILCLNQIIDFCIIEEGRGNHIYAKNKDLLAPTIKYLAQFIGHKDRFPYQQLYDWHYYEQDLLYEIDRMKRLKRGNGITRRYKNLGETRKAKELVLQ